MSVINSDDIFLYIHQDNLDGLKCALKKFGTEETDFFGDTPLLYAVSMNKAESVKTLIEFGADVYAKSYLGDMPFHVASKKGFLDIVRIFCENGIDLNALGQEGFTALGYAVFFGFDDVAKYLILNGASLDICDDISDKSPRDKILQRGAGELFEIVRQKSTGYLG